MNTSTEFNRTCVPQEIHKVALLIPLPAIGALTNIMVGCAATFYRKSLLRQNYVYFCVISTLLSNLVFLALNLWDASATLEAIINFKLTNNGGMGQVSRLLFAVFLLKKEF